MTAPLASLPSPLPSRSSAVALRGRGAPPPTAESLATSGTRSTSSSLTVAPVPADIEMREARTSEPSSTGSCAPAPDTDQTSAAKQATTARPAHERRRRIACRCAVVGRSTTAPLAMGPTLVHVPAAGTQRVLGPADGVVPDLVGHGCSPYCGPRPMTAGWRTWATTTFRRSRMIRAASAGHSASRHTSEYAAASPERPAPGLFLVQGLRVPPTGGTTQGKEAQMANSEKTAAIAEIADKFRESGAAVLTEYRGLTVAQLSQLRTSIREHATYAVVKNTLTERAAKEAGITAFDG